MNFWVAVISAVNQIHSFKFCSVFFWGSITTSIQLLSDDDKIQTWSCLLPQKQTKKPASNRQEASQRMNPYGQLKNTLTDRLTDRERDRQTTDCLSISCRFFLLNENQNKTKWKSLCFKENVNNEIILRKKVLEWNQLKFHLNCSINLGNYYNLHRWVFSWLKRLMWILPNHLVDCLLTKFLLFSSLNCCTSLSKVVDVQKIIHIHCC